MLKYKIMFQIFFVPKYFWVLEALIFGTLLPDHPVVFYKTDRVLLIIGRCISISSHRARESSSPTLEYPGAVAEVSRCQDITDCFDQS